MNTVSDERIARLSQVKQELLRAMRSRQTGASRTYPLSFGQQGLWLNHEASPENTSYNTVTGVRLEGTTDYDALGDAVESVVQRHEVLRSRIEYGDRGPVQIVQDRWSGHLEIEHSPHPGKTECDAWVDSVIKRELRHVFDLGRGELIRTTALIIDDRTCIFILSIHHIAIDRWSMDILLREVMTFYTASIRGEVADLPPLPVQYGEFALWERSRLREPAVEQHLLYWRERLGGMQVLRLPRDREAPAESGADAAETAIVLEAGLVQTLKELGSGVGATLFMTLLAGFKLVLARWLHEQDICIGTDVANRNRKEFEPLIGFFVNQVALRTDLSGNPTVRELLERVRNTTIGAFNHQELPFARVVEELKLPRNPHESPLFQIKMTMQNAALPAPASLSGAPFLPIHIQPDNTETDIVLSVAENAGEVHATLVYRRDLYRAGTMHRLLVNWKSALAQMGAHRNSYIGDLRIASPDETHELAYRWNQTDSPAVGGLCLHELIREQVHRNGSACAIEDGHLRLSYEELECRANRLAHYLLDRDSGPETRIGVLMDSGVELIVGMLGILKAGAAYVPLDPGLPAERLSYIAADAGISMLLTSGVSELPAGLARDHVIDLQAVWPVVGALSGAEPARSSVNSANIAYILYTSGSTGRPKGVMITHAGLVNYVQWARSFYAPSEGWIAPLHTSPAFDLTVTSIWVPLAAGARVMVLDRRSATEHLHHVLSSASAGQRWLIKLTPSHLRALTGFGAISGRDGEKLTGVVVAGGEALAGTDVREWARAGGDGRMLNEYGPTEATVGCCIYEARQKDESAMVPIGLPIANTRAYALDESGQLAPLQAIGELFIAGAGLARGYLNQPALTAERFLPDPFATPGGERMYKTGDLVRRLPDGNLTFLGRADQQVKVRGYRIELGEIESVIREHTGIGQVAVVVREDGSGEKRLAAYVAGRNGTRPPDAETLTGFLRARLPDYMVPASFVEVSALPLTSNGKLDISRLPIPHLDINQTYVPPGTPAEEILCGLWERALGRERISTISDVFDLGADSLLCLQVVAEARKAGLRATVRQIFAEPTIKGLAKVVVRAESALAGETADDTEDLPLAPIQQWFFRRPVARVWHWNQSLLLRTPALKPGLVRAVIAALLDRHDAFRMRYERDENGDWRQWSEPRLTPRNHYGHVDLSAVAPGRRREVLEHCAERAQSSLDLGSGPLFRALSFDMGEGDGRLLLIAHHLAIDFVSWRIVLQALEEGYTRLLEGKQLPVAECAASYRQWMRFLSTQTEEQWLTSESRYWAKTSGKAARCRLPRDFEGGRNTNSSVGKVNVLLSARETRALLQDVPTRSGIRISEILMAGLARTLCEWTGRRAAAFDLDGHGREDLPGCPDVSGTVGWFTSVYPICLELNQQTGTKEQLDELVRQLRAVPNGGTGFGILKYLRADRQVSAYDSAEVAFNYAGQSDQVLSRDGWSVASESSGPLQWDGETRPYEIEIVAGVRNGQLHVEWSYSSERYKHQTIEGLAETMTTEVRTLIFCVLGSEIPSSAPDAPSRRVTPDHSLSYDDRPALVPQERPVRTPLSYAQQRLWFLDRLQGRSTEYNILEAFRLRNDLDVSALRKALRTIVERHEILRTCFPVSGDSPEQLVGAEAEIHFETEDLSEWDEHAQRPRVIEAMRQFSEFRFDLGCGPLLRVLLIALGPRDHILLKVTHHIVSDLWSEGIFNHELRTLYSAYHEGRENPLAPLPVQYSDYALWQRRWLEEGALAEGLAYWKNQLAGMPSRIELAGDHARPVAQTFGAGAVISVLDQETVAGLKRLGRAYNASLYMTLLSAFAVLLARYTGQDDIAIGSPAANRDGDPVTRMIGLFVNNVVIRVRAGADMPFCGILNQVSATVLSALRYQDIPLEKVVTELGFERTASATPGYQIIFALQNVPWEAAAMAGIEIESLGEPELKTHLDLEVLAWQRDGEFHVSWVYNRDLFDHWRIEQMASHYTRILGSVLKDANLRTEEIELLTPAERSQVLEAWNPPAEEIAPGTLPELFERQVSSAPESIAVSYEDSLLTYGVLNREANRLAHLLVRAGIGPEDMVVVALPRSARLVVTVAAVLKAGAAYVPVDPAYPLQRVAGLLEKAGCRAAITTAALAGTLAAPGRRLIVLDDPSTERALLTMPAADLTDGDRVHPLRPGNAAYTIHTSGSTGVPKGVVVSHESVIGLLRAVERQVCFSSADTGMLFHSLTSDLSVWEIWAPLSRGARLVVVPPAISRSPNDFLHLLADRNVTVLGQTPAALYQLMNADMQSPGTRGSALRAVVVGGEALEAVRLRHWLENRTDHRPSIYNFYGPTEVTVWASSHSVTPDDIGEGSPAVVSIGRPLQGYRLYVLDGNLTPVPAGVPGEVCVAGAGLARAYSCEPAATAEKFVPSPFAPEPGGRLYRTGDRGRWLPDGRLEFLGRADRQMKLRGFRIEPGEIEAALAQQPEVKQAAVVIQQSQGGEARLVAFITARDGHVQVAELRDRLRAILPDYMVPSRIAILDAFPLTATGKLDRDALSALEADVCRPADALRLDPRDGTECYVKRIWEDVLGVGDLSLRDNFFDVGGHSMNSVAVVAKLSDLYGLALPVASVFEYPTIEEYSAYLRQRVASAPPRVVVPIHVRGDRPPLFLVPPAGGLANVYLELSRALGADQPLYSFQSRGFIAGEPMHHSIEDMAADYIRDMRTVSPSGPYYIGGWCMGGVVAYEMCRQLAETGDQVNLLVMLDAAVPYAQRGKIAPDMKQERTAPTDSPPAARAAQLCRLARLEAEWKKSGQIPADVTTAQLGRFRQVFARNIRAERSYRFRPYAGRITFLSAREGESDFTGGWGCLTEGRVAVHRISGPHHLLVLPPHVGPMAQTLRSVLDAATEVASQ